jgi:hypothetical protein
MGFDNKTLIDLFKFAPAIVALFGVIWLMYRIIIKKDETMRKMAEGTRSDVERQAKMVALLEILVNRGGQKP